jgi:uncharacterized protein YaiE (UPF0345 family)
MTYRSIKLGLVLAVLALSGVAAQAAQAGEFTAEQYPATVTGNQISKHTFKFEAGTVECTVAKFHGTLEAAAETLTVGASYEQCATPNGGAAVGVNMNGCDYEFNAGATVEADKVEGTLDIVCPEGKEIELKEAANGCTVKIPSQNGLSKLIYTDHTMARDFDVDIGVTGMSYTQNANCAGGMGTFANGEYGGSSTMTGEKEGMADGLIVK